MHYNFYIFSSDFAGGPGGRPYVDGHSEGDYRSGSPMYQSSRDQSNSSGGGGSNGYSFHPFPPNNQDGFNQSPHFGGIATEGGPVHKLPSSPLDLPNLQERQQFPSQVFMQAF